jgi:AcrR family transcriptional regulator
VPKLWDSTIDAHRHAVRDATLDAAAALVAEHGLPGVTMSQIASSAGIGRATLYRYFPDVESVLSAWHERQVHRHLAELAEIRDPSQSPWDQLHAVLEAYGLLAHGHDGSEVAAGLHRLGHVNRAQRQLQDFIRDLLADGARRGDVRADVAPDELAAYCLHALGAAGTLRSKAAVRRLVAVTLSGLRPAPN